MALEAKDRPQSMQSWIEMLGYKSSTSNKPTKTIPWVSLTIVLLVYFIIGYILTADNAQFLLWAVVVAMAWAWAWAEIEIWTIWGVLVAYYVAGVTAMAAAGAGAGAGVTAVAVVMLVVVNVLGNSFSKFHTFLIVAGTSNIGLGLGWIVYRLFKPV
ncbi:MAG: hypothetical protein HEQ31_10080 [Dolichospermum sp. OL03]|nr:hypothetical protein [Dolichospermum sp. OL01]MCO5797109.1 hypothetical protein [Dolichospermum sp. OL03]MCS6279712.1 hypothetical protein [Dolichospermum sp.]